MLDVLAVFLFVFFLFLFLHGYDARVLYLVHTFLRNNLITFLTFAMAFFFFFSCLFISRTRSFFLIWGRFSKISTRVFDQTPSALEFVVAVSQYIDFFFCIFLFFIFYLSYDTLSYGTFDHTLYTLTIP